MDGFLLAAGISAFLAVPALVAAALFLVLFVQGKGAQWGLLNDLFSAIALLLLVLPALAIDRLADGFVGGWFNIVTAAAVAGIALAALGQLLLVARLIPLSASFLTGGLGVMPVMVWVAAQGYIGLRYGIPAPSLGVLATAVLATSLLLTGSSIALGRLSRFLTANLLVATLAAYLTCLGTVLIIEASR